MIWRVETYSNQMGSEGFAYFATKAEADAFCARLREQGYEPESKFSIDASYEVESTYTPRTRLQIVALLNRWANHPDNG